jgi:hypothetical protein
MAALNRGETITVWLDPDSPTEAVISPPPPWQKTGTGVLLAFLFSVGGIALFLFTRPRTLPDIDPAAPWQARAAWRDNLIRSDARPSLYLFWLLAIIASVFAYGWARELEGSPLDSDGMLGNPFLLLTQEVAAALLFVALRESWRWLRYGASPLRLDPFPGAIGGDVGGEILFRHPFSRRITAEVRLQLEQTDVEREREPRTTRWEEGGYAQIAPHAKGVMLRFRFAVPAGLPASDTSYELRRHKRYYYNWQLHMQLHTSGSSISRRFEIPVYPLAARSSISVATVETPHHSPFKNSWQAMRQLLPIKGNEERFTLDFPMRGFSTWMVVKLLYGIQLCAFGAAMMLHPTAAHAGLHHGRCPAAVPRTLPHRNNPLPPPQLPASRLQRQHRAQ